MVMRDQGDCYLKPWVAVDGLHRDDAPVQSEVVREPATLKPVTVVDKYDFIGKAGVIEETARHLHHVVACLRRHDAIPPGVVVKGHEADVRRG